MTAHDRHIQAVKAFPDAAQSRGTRPLDGHDALRLAQKLMVFTPDGRQISALMEKARKAIPMLTSAEVVQRLASHNPDCFWGIARRDKFKIQSPEAEGYYAFLPLNADGMRGLLDGSLDRKNPPLTHVAAQSEKAACVYLWHAFAPGHLAIAITLACQKMWTLQNKDADIYCWCTNDDASRFVERLGFEKIPEIARSAAPRFHVFRRSDEDHPTAIHEPAPLTAPASIQPQAQNLSVKVARNLDDFMRAVSIRGAVYMGEQECPYEEEFDGNDFSATHLVGYVDNEPAGCMRIRYFADFAKVERLVVRKEFRSSGLAREIVRASVDLCQSKGFERVYVYAQKRLVKFWSKCGFALPPNARELAFSDFDYVEMINLAPRRSDAISEKTSPYVIIRPEGNWQTKGVLEHSIARGLRRPSAQDAAA